MRKPKTLTNLKKELDIVFSRYIRLRNADDNGDAICVTCGVKNHWKKLQNGHFMSRRHSSTRWDEDNCQVQCYSCNVMQQGKQYEYSIWLGVELADELLALSRETRKFSNIELQEMIEIFKEKIERIGKK